MIDTYIKRDPELKSFESAHESNFLFLLHLLGRFLKFHDIFLLYYSAYPVTNSVADSVHDL